MAVGYESALKFVVDSKELDKLEKKLESIDKDLKGIKNDKSFDDLGNKSKGASANFQKFKVVAVAAGAAIGTALLAAGAATYKLMGDVSKVSVEFERLSIVAGTSSQNLQKMSAGANTVGVSSEKLADILKDTQDKIGDFVATGGGALTDFFEVIGPKVGVTIEQFRKLSGPEALQLYYTSLEKAGANSQDMIFYMEALASDSALLMPLLKDNGKGFEEWGNKAEDLGAIIGGDLSQSMKEFDAIGKDVDLLMQGLKITLVQTLGPAVQFVTSHILDGVIAFIKYKNEARSLQNMIDGAGTATVRDYEKQLERAQRNLEGLRDGSWRPTNAADIEMSVQWQKYAESHNIAAGNIAERERWLQGLMVKFSMERNELLDDEAKLRADLANAPRLGQTVKPTSAPKATSDPETKAFESRARALREQIDLYGMTDEAAKALYATTVGNMKNLSVDQKNVIMRLSEEFDLKKAIAKEEEAIKSGSTAMKQFDDDLLANQEALRLIQAGKITSQEQLNRFLEDENFLRDINRQIEAGTLVLTDEQVESLKRKREELIATGEAIDKSLKRPLIDIQAQMQDGIIGGIGTAFDRMFEGVSVGFDELLADMAKQLLKSMVMNYLMNGMAGGGWGGAAFMSSNGFAKGGAFNNGTQFFAKGGVVNGATAFGMRGGMGVMGEAGPEAIMPLTRGPDGKLGVQSSGGASIIVSPGAVVVNASKDSEEDARKTSMAIKQMIDMQIGNWMKNAQRPGGTLNSSFGQQRY